MKESPFPGDISAKQNLSAAWLIISVYVVWSSIDLKKPWIGAHDWNGAAWSTAAKHLIERPISETRFGVSLDHGSGPLDPKKSYVHHPPLVVWLMAGAYKLFGVSESVGRLVPALFTLFGAACVGGTAVAFAGYRGGVLSQALFLTMPAQLYYGRMPNHEPVALPLMIAATCFAGLWHFQPTTKRLVICLFFVALACLSSWAAFFFAATLGLVALRTPNGRTLFVGVALTASAVLAFLLWHIRYVRPDGWNELLAAFFLRSGGVGVGEWLATEANWLCRMLTPVGAAAVLLHATRLLRLPPEAERAILPLVVAGWANVLLFRQGAFVHEYYAFYLGAPAALILGLTLSRDATKSLITIVLGATLLAGLLLASELRKEQSRLYASDVPESPRFVVELGKKIAETFPANATLLVDVAPIGEHLAFYADRRMVYLAQLTEAELGKVVGEVDGIVANTRLAATRELLNRALALAGDRVVERREFGVEGHTFAAVKLRKGR